MGASRDSSACAGRVLRDSIFPSTQSRPVVASSSSSSWGTEDPARDSSAAAQSAPNPLCSYGARTNAKTGPGRKRELANKDSSNPPLGHTSKIVAVQLRCLLHWQRKSLVSSRVRSSHCRCASELGQDRYRAIRAGTPETHFWLTADRRRSAREILGARDIGAATTSHNR